MYDDQYYQHYEDLEGTEVCDQLNKVRLELVDTFIQDLPLLDMGIGAGTFIKERGGYTYGYDVNPRGIAWLQKCQLLLDPYTKEDRFIHAMSFWDVLEHLPHADEVLRKIERFAFVSMPIYDDLDHVLRSKHFKKGEHCLYFTKLGLINWMAEHGFTCRLSNTSEVDCGREDIGSFVFERAD